MAVPSESFWEFLGKNLLSLANHKCRIKGCLGKTRLLYRQPKPEIAGVKPVATRRLMFREGPKVGGRRIPMEEG